MKKTVLLLIIAGLVIFCSCSKKTEDNQTTGKDAVKKQTETGVNPLLSEFDTPFNVPPFDKIKVEHYLPAIQKGIKDQEAEIDAVVKSTEAPTFANTIEALEKSGSQLTRTRNVFNVLKASMTNASMQKAAKDIAPLVSGHRDNIRLNDKLFARVKAVYDQKDKLGLNMEQTRLLDKIYKEFVRGGANLAPEDKAKLKIINEELSVLTLKFGDNILEENNRFQMVLDKKEDLAGLPQSVIDGAAETAKAKGQDGKWVFTLHKPSLIPFITYSHKRELREKMFKGYITRGDHNDHLDNKKTLLRITELRINKAKLLGYETHAHFKLEENMSKTPDNVSKFLNQLWKPALKQAKKEAAELQAMIKKDGKDFKLQPWDWWYYSEKLKKEKYDLDEEMLRPYFKMENVRDGAFAVATKLWGITFTERSDIPVYHKDAKAFEVKEADGSHVGILYVDYFPRESKRGGAWMNEFRGQSNRDGKMIRPVITNNGNFSKPTGDKPALLSFEEVSTLFHEFGHALHGLLSQCTYGKLAGTEVAIDFVELPSQIMENWASHPEVLKMYAKHYETGEVIPQELVDKVKKAGLFNQGFITVEYLAAAFLDLDWQNLTSVEGLEANAFETKSLDALGLIPEIVVRYRSSYFSHIFAGGYSAGYYSYIWAEVLDADAFEAFKEKGIFDRETAKAYRVNILERGGTDDPMELYKKFRGAEPKVDPLLKKRGLN